MPRQSLCPTGAAPEPAVSLRKQGEPHGCSLSDEGCLSTPGLGPNSQLAPLGEAGGAERQPVQAVASPKLARVTVWATGTVQDAPQEVAPEPDKVTAGAAVSALRVVNPLFGHKGDRVAGTPYVHSQQGVQDAGLEPMVAEEEMNTVYVQCKHGWALISGEHDDTIQPLCSREECKEGGGNWLRSEGLMAAMSGAQRVVNPLCTVAVLEPARVMVRATDQGRH